MSKAKVQFINLNQDLKAWRTKVEISIKKGSDKKFYKDAAKYVSEYMASYIRKNQYTLGATMRNGNKRPEVVYRYKKGTKGEDPVAGYKYGNLSRSIKVLTHLKKSNKLWVGPDTRQMRVGAGGYVYYSNKRKVDPYYAHMVNNGTVKQKGMFYLERTREAVSSKVNSMLRGKARKTISYWLKKYKVA